MSRVLYCATTQYTVERLPERPPVELSYWSNLVVSGLLSKADGSAGILAIR